VKFAKLKPSLNENDRNMLSAIDFVNTTKDVEEENRKPVEKTVVNERSLVQKRWLIAAIVAVLCVVVAVAALLITDLGHMFG
jgi:CHASE3 domain sensor protein